MYSVSAKEETGCCPELNVKVDSNGFCSWYLEYQQSVTHCPMDVTWFPFDDQRCKLTFEPKTHESKELNMTYVPQASTMADYLYETNGEWTLVGKG